MIEQNVFNEENRKILRLKLLDGRSHQQIAEELNISVSAEKKRYYAAVERLKDKIGTY